MAVTFAKKEEILDFLQGEVASQKCVLLLSTNATEASLDAEANFKLRNEARKQGVALKVVKNTLIKRTFQNVPDLVGPTYLAYLVDKDESDEIKVPKAVVGLVKDDFKTSINVIGAVVNGEFLDAQQTITLSNTPSFNDSMSMLAGALSQAISRIAVAVNEVPSSLARSLNEYSKKQA